MKNNWQTKKLGEVCDFFADGNWIESKDQSQEGIRLIQTGNIGDGFFKDRGEKARYISEKTFRRLRCTEIFAGDILISRLPDPVGRACIVPETDEKMITAVDCSILRLKKTFLAYFFNYFSQSNSYLDSVERETTGTTRKRISRKNLGLIEIPVPPIEKQKRIVHIVDEVFEKIEKVKANSEKNLQNSKDLFESYLQSVFAYPGEDWGESKLKEIGISQTGTTPKTVEKENYGDFIPFIKPADVDFSGVGDIRYDHDGLSEVGLKRGRKMEKGSILMVCIGATIGKVGFAEKLVSCNQQINSLTVKEDFEPKFIYYAMTSKEFQNRVLSEGKGAQATLPIINKTKWESLTIRYPIPKTEQKSIVAKLDALSEQTKKLEGIYKQKLADLEELKKSVLKQAFKGEL
ncbi:MAG: restriction endonuclease subunit S [Candidatus Berkelbacteria bacterium]|nr:restriction endonuclease subunit S [Candidatus Berkelbacteria bacterium]